MAYAAQAVFFRGAFSLSTAVADSPPDAALLVQLTGLRDAFVSQVRAEGFKPSLPPPTLVLDNPPSCGNYEDDRNLLHIGAWSALTPAMVHATMPNPVPAGQD